MKRLLSVVLMVAISGIALVVTSVAVTPGLVQAQQPIRIGATMSETGSYATQGVPARAVLGIGTLLTKKRDYALGERHLGWGYHAETRAGARCPPHRGDATLGGMQPNDANDRL